MGGICLGFQMVALVKRFQQGDATRRVDIWRYKKHTRDSPSQVPSKLLDSVSSGVRITIYMPFGFLLQAHVPDSHKCCMSLWRAWGEERKERERGNGQ